jgi:hypothetical protein
MPGEDQGDVFEGKGEKLIETYQLWLVIGSSVTLITGGLSWLLSMIKSQERRISDLEVKTAVIEAVQKERGK